MISVENEFTIKYIENHSTSLADDFKTFLVALNSFGENQSEQNKNILYKEWEYLMFAIKGSLAVDVIREDFAKRFSKYIGELVDDRF